MPSHDDGCTLREAYLLHELTPDEVTRFEGHLASCRSCQEHLADTAQLLRALADLEPPDEPVTGSQEPSMAHDPRPARVAGHHLRRRRGALIGLAGLIVGASLTFALEHPAEQTPSAAEVIALTAPPIHGTLVVDRRAWGSSITLTATGLPSRGQVSLVVRSTGGQVVDAAWRAIGPQRISVQAPTPFQPSAIAATMLVAHGRHTTVLWSWHRLGTEPGAT